RWASPKPKRLTRTATATGDGRGHAHGGGTGNACLFPEKVLRDLAPIHLSERGLEKVPKHVGSGSEACLRRFLVLLFEPFGQRQRSRILGVVDVGLGLARALAQVVVARLFVVEPERNKPRLEGRPAVIDLAARTVRDAFGARTKRLSATLTTNLVRHRHPPQ